PRERPVAARDRATWHCFTRSGPVGMPRTSERFSMARILLRSAQDPAAVLPAAESLRRMGGNAGNLLYAHAVHRALSVAGTEVVAGAFDLEELDDPRAWAADV